VLFPYPKLPMTGIQPSLVGLDSLRQMGCTSAVRSGRPNLGLEDPAQAPVIATPDNEKAALR